MLTTTRAGALRGLRRAAAALGLAAVVGLAGLTLVPALLGYERYVITSGSMTGSVDRGALLYGKAVPVGDLRVGDVITYTPPPEAGSRGRVTHRIASIARGPQGFVLRTRGDANPSPDPWRFVPTGPELPRAEMDVPYVGYAFAALSERWVRMLVLGLPALLVALAALGGLWRDASEAARARPEVGSR